MVTNFTQIKNQLGQYNHQQAVTVIETAVNSELGMITPGWSGGRKFILVLEHQTFTGSMNSLVKAITQTLENQTPTTQTNSQDLIIRKLAILKKITKFDQQGYELLKVTSKTTQFFTSIRRWLGSLGSWSKKERGDEIDRLEKSLTAQQATLQTAPKPADPVPPKTPDTTTDTQTPSTVNWKALKTEYLELSKIADPEARVKAILAKLKEIVQSSVIKLSKDKTPQLELIFKSKDDCHGFREQFATKNPIERKDIGGLTVTGNRLMELLSFPSDQNDQFVQLMEKLAEEQTVDKPTPTAPVKPKAESGGNAEFDLDRHFAEKLAKEFPVCEALLKEEKKA